MCTIYKYKIALIHGENNSLSTPVYPTKQQYMGEVCLLYNRTAFDKEKEMPWGVEVRNEIDSSLHDHTKNGRIQIYFLQFIDKLPPHFFSRGYCVWVIANNSKFILYN